MTLVAAATPVSNDSLSACMAYVAFAMSVIKGNPQGTLLYPLNALTKRLMDARAHRCEGAPIGVRAGNDVTGYIRSPSSRSRGGPGRRNSSVKGF